MSQTTAEYTGERVTFRELFDRHPIVEIPIVQRDYAQGRTAALEIRTTFIDALHGALSKSAEDSDAPLDLDFVYGSVEGTDRRAFLPLDGQQRLTTLFLLHWYLAWKDGKSPDFMSFMKTDRKSRFSYAVRTSSEEFFDELVGYIPAIAPKDVRSSSALVVEQSWFFRSWKLDPSVQSALTMLDAIHARFANAQGFYDRLVQTGSPRIAFQLLELRSFGLSDDLYIKMNARGKLLTPFETFKAKLEQHLAAHYPNEAIEVGGRRIALKKYFSDQIDTRWADLFWNYRDKRTALFDEKIMHLFRVLAIVTRTPDQDGIEKTIATLMDGEVSLSFKKYQDLKCLDLPLVTTFVALLDTLCAAATGITWHLTDGSLYQEKPIFERALRDSTKLIYPDLVQFHGYCAFIAKHRGSMRSEVFSEWMRIIANLTENTIYDRLSDFTRDIRTINKLLGKSDQILAFFSKADTGKLGFNEQQVREEKLKAQLCLKSPEWKSLILTAERHGYFRGQIEFLFKFSGVLDRWLKDKAPDWSDSEDAEYRRRFSDYFAKASAIFSSAGLNDFGLYRWERALLAKGDYMLEKGRNHSFLDKGDRDASWKRLLRGPFSKWDQSGDEKRQHVQQLLDEIDLSRGVKESLDAVLAQASPPESWRRAIIESPEVIAFCWGRMTRRHPENKNIFLLRKSQMNGEHAELFSYHLRVGLLSTKNQKGELAPFGAPEYYAVKNESEEPCAYLEWRRADGIIALDIHGSDGAYRLALFKRYGQMPSDLQDAFVDQAGFERRADGELYQKVEHANIGTAIDHVVHVARQDSPTGN